MSRFDEGFVRGFEYAKNGKSLDHAPVEDVEVYRMVRGMCPRCSSVFSYPYPETEDEDPAAFLARNIGDSHCIPPGQETFLSGT